MKHSTMIFGAMMSISLGILAVPKAVYIIRHGEKQIAKNACGCDEVNEKGKPKYTRYLSHRGWQRAYAISFDPVFYDNPEHGVPAACFGSSPVGAEGSLRPIETITPLAKRLKKPVIKHYLPTDHKKVADYIKNNPDWHNKFIVMAWEHNNIPALAQAFGAHQAPKVWNGKYFDRIWQIIFDPKTGKVSSFEDVAQELLFGDSSR